MKKEVKAEFIWEVDKIRGSFATFIPELQPGWEPFNVTNEGSIYWIWLRRKVLSK